MRLESVSQIPIEHSYSSQGREHQRVLTTVVIGEVDSVCILSRQIIDRLGRPGVESDMEMVGSDRTWTIAWTQPYLTFEQATDLVNQAIAPKSI